MYILYTAAVVVWWEDRLIKLVQQLYNNKKCSANLMVLILRIPLLSSFFPLLLQSYFIHSFHTPLSLPLNYEVRECYNLPAGSCCNPIARGFWCMDGWSKFGRTVNDARLSSATNPSPLRKLERTKAYWFPTHHSHHPPPLYSFIPGLKPFFSANPSQRNLFFIFRTDSMDSQTVYRYFGAYPFFNFLHRVPKTSTFYFLKNSVKN